jgi:glyoxylase-like metal-dependent hydrolase (beta-lactamase superfamily II)
MEQFRFFCENYKAVSVNAAFLTSHGIAGSIEMTGSLHDSIIELADHFYLIIAPNKSQFPFCNTFLLCGRKTVLIDAGLSKKTLTAIDREKRIDTVVFSHSHPDHILRWHLLRDRHILMPQETPDSVFDLNFLGTRFMGTPEKGAHWVKLIGEGLGLRPLREPDQRFCDGDVLEIDGFELQAIHAPGHLGDHYVFFEKRNGILLTSDIDFSGFGPFYGQPECDITLFKQSIEKVMSLPYRLVCSSHKMPMYGDRTHDFKKFLDGFERHRKKILSLCKTPRSLNELVDSSPVYMNRMWDKVLQDTFEEGMISKSLDLMIKDGLIRRSGGKYILSGDVRDKIHHGTSP